MKNTLIFIALAIIIAIFIPLILVSNISKIDLQLTDMSLKNPVYTPNEEGAEKISINFKGTERSYFIFLPQKIDSTMPVLVALHGSGRPGSSMTDTWRSTAEKNSIVVLAPNSLNGNWDLSLDPADFISTVINDALTTKQIKSSHIYLFGHSNGAKQAIALAAIHPEMFHGVAAHAGTLPLDVYKGVKHERKVRVAMFLGDSDHIFSIASGRKTVRWLSSLGIDSTLYILKNHSHWYYHEAERINEFIWEFLTQKYVDTSK